jgi:ethanolamine ammonia-lyase large subunit
MFGMNSEVVGCLPKLMSNQELIAVDKKIFNPLPGTKIGAKGYLSARIQPNSPTDDPEEIQWQVFSAFSYAVGDLVLGTNPVDGTKESTAKVEAALKSVVDGFKLNGTIPGACWPILTFRGNYSKRSRSWLISCFRALQELMRQIKHLI